MGYIDDWVKDVQQIGVEGRRWPWIVAILGGVVISHLIMKSFFRSGSELKVPPGPRNLPLVGALLTIAKEPNLIRCFGILREKFGPIVYYRLGNHSVVIISSAEAAEEVLKTQDVHFANRASTTILRNAAKYLAFKGETLSISDYEDQMKIVRKAFTTQLFTASKLASYEKIRRREGIAMVEDVRRQFLNEGRNNRVNVREVLTTMSANTVYALLSGKQYSDATFTKADEERRRTIEALMSQLCGLYLKFNVTDLFPSLEWLDPQRLRVQYMEYQQLSTKCFMQFLEEHREARRTGKNVQAENFVDFLLTLHESGKITENAILGGMLDLVSGGIDTNTTASEWALLQLVKNPETLAKLQKEIDEVVGKSRQVEESDFSNMPYLQAVVKEALRLHPPLPLLIPHVNKSPTMLGGYYIPAKTTVFVNAYAIARDPHSWECPDKFNPERFLIKESDSQSRLVNVTGSDYRVLPFGSGRRMCVGYSLGLLFVQRMVSSLVHAFDWSPPLGLGVDDINAQEELSVVCHPMESLVLRATPRLDPGIYKSQHYTSS